MIDPEVMRRLDQLASLIRQLQGSLSVDGAGLNFDVGTGTLVFSAAANSNALTITHSLGTTPLYVGAIATTTTGSGLSFSCGSLDSDSFDLIGWTGAGGSITANVAILWLAIG